MDTNIPSNLPTGSPSDPSFQVMPKEGEIPAATPVPAPPLPRSLPGAPPPRPPQNSAPTLPEEPDASFLKSKLAYIIIGAVVLVVFGALAYFLLGSKKTPAPVQQTPQTKLPKVWLQQYFSKETCDDQKTCGDEADPDSDGFSNYNEFKSGVKPINPDTDSDGLADGDEVYIYKTDPALKYTDRRDIVAQNDWTDSVQIKNGYDPVTPGLKFTDSRKTQIADDTIKYKLHQPTIASLQATP